MKLRIATVRIKSLTPYSQSKALQSEKPKEESYDDFNKRIWPERMHVNDAGDVFIPAAGISQGLAAAASYLGKGGNLKKKGNATWAQNFMCGLAIAAGPTIGLKVKEARAEPIYCHADGKRTPGPRVWRTYPVFDQWAATLEIHILDETIPEGIFSQVVEAFGLFIGIGRHRPQNGGYLGRFTVEKLTIKTA